MSRLLLILRDSELPRSTTVDGSRKIESISCRMSSEVTARMFGSNYINFMRP